ncbi:hypothetical protein [Amycolatopsis palatopharyngis]|uniref:hypothetical protein n=1 Tax=Amycolatopsis palatopharyngis TaxID=187982 RepID=UPI000E25AF04|nr:hypothetical protein [Amycolatopsis palatopharyngis]
MAALTAQVIDTAGTAVTFASADVAGDTFKASNDRAKLKVDNASAGSITVTIPVHRSVVGLDVPDRVVAVAAGAFTEIPLLKSLYADPADGNIDITYSAVASVTVAITTD